jgi:mRNA interferase HigB
MVVISNAILAKFTLKHPLSAEALNKWYEVVKECDWKNFFDVKKVFNSVDAVGNDRYVFNIKGNDYRLVTMIFFDKRTIYIRFVGTHAEYDKIDCSTV